MPTKNSFLHFLFGQRATKKRKRMLLPHAAQLCILYWTQVQPLPFCLLTQSLPQCVLWKLSWSLHNICQSWCRDLSKLLQILPPDLSRVSVDPCKCAHGSVETSQGLQMRSRSLSHCQLLTINVMVWVCQEKSLFHYKITKSLPTSLSLYWNAVVTSLSRHEIDRKMVLSALWLVKHIALLNYRY